MSGVWEVPVDSAIGESVVFVEAATAEQAKRRAYDCRIGSGAWDHPVDFAHEPRLVREPEAEDCEGVGV